MVYNLLLNVFSLSLILCLNCRLWNIANTIYFADGASNRVYNALHGKERELFIPHCIAGDFDSIVEPVKIFYRSFDM